MSKADRIITASPTWALWTICVEPGRGHLLPTALLASSSLRQRPAINLYSAKNLGRNAQDYFIETVLIPQVLHGALLLVKGNRKLPHLWDLFSNQILQIICHHFHALCWWKCAPENVALQQGCLCHRLLLHPTGPATINGWRSSVRLNWRAL